MKTEWNMPDSGLRAPERTLVAVRATVPVAQMPPNSAEPTYSTYGRSPGRPAHVRNAFPLRDGSTPFTEDESLAILGAPAQERPNDPTAVVPLIRALVEGGQTGAALDRAQAMVRDNPGVPGAYVMLGDVLMVQGRSADAAAAYKQAADLRFDEPTMLRLIEALEASGRRGEVRAPGPSRWKQQPARAATATRSRTAAATLR